jgi:hypothetical protein
MRLFNAQCFCPACEAQPVFPNDGLSFVPRLCQTRAVQPNIEAAGVWRIVAQFFFPGFLESDFLGAGFAKLPVCNAASAANGEFSSDLRGRGALPAE